MPAARFLDRHARLPLGTDAAATDITTTTTTPTRVRTRVCSWS